MIRANRELGGKSLDQTQQRLPSATSGARKLAYFSSNLALIVAKLVTLRLTIASSSAAVVALFTAQTVQRTPINNRAENAELIPACSKGASS